jgi:integrase
MLSTLARVGELTQARWEHVDLESGTWTIPAGNSKNAKAHTIFLSEFARRYFEELRTLTGWSEWCYPSTRNEGHLCLRSISKQIKDRQRDTALSNRSLRGLGALTLPGGNWTAHDLRRTGATLMGELGILSEVIEKCLNHVEANKLKRTYQRHELKSERREAWRVLGAHLDSLLHGEAGTNVIHASFGKVA